MTTGVGVLVTAPGVLVLVGVLVTAPGVLVRVGVGEMVGVKVLVGVFVGPQLLNWAFVVLLPVQFPEFTVMFVRVTESPLSLVKIKLNGPPPRFPLLVLTAQYSSFPTPEPIKTRLV